MSVFRLDAHRALAAMVVAAALLLKVLVPAGTMVGGGPNGLVITICSATSPRSVTIEAAGLGRGAPGDHRDDHGKAEQPCAFAALSHATLAAIDPVQLAALLAFVLFMGMAAVMLPAVAPLPRLRPPSRAPPAA